MDDWLRCDGETWSPQLVGGRCRHCGTVTLGLKRSCPNCWQRDAQEPIDLSRRGTLYAYTIIRNAPPGHSAPYAVAYVDLPEKLRVMVRAETDRIADLACGAEVEIAVVPIATDEDGTIVVGPAIQHRASAESQA